MKAKPTKRQQSYNDALYESLQNLRAAERALAELCRLDYTDVYQCNGCGEPILDNAHSFISGGRHYHNERCAYIEEVEELTNGE